MKRHLKNSVSSLLNGDLILYPTDTVWGIGCDATNEIAIEKIFTLKQRQDSKTLIILVDSYTMLSHYVDVSNDIKHYLSNTKEPTTVIYQNPRNLPGILIAKDHTIAIRIVRDEFVKKLIKTFEKPIVSTSANISGKKTPLCFSEISNTIKNGVHYIVPYKHNIISTKSSKIIRFADNKIEVLRN